MSNPESTDTEQLTRILTSFHTVLRSVNQAADRVRLDKGALIVLYTLHTTDTSRPSEIAAACKLDQSTVSRHLKSLEDEGLVVRTPDPRDGRAQVAEATAEGVATMDKINAERLERLGAALEGWSGAERDQLANVLDRLSASILASADHSS